MTDLRDGTRDGTSDDQHVPVGSVRSAALSGEAASTEATATETAVLDLDDPRATDREVVGGKGAALAIAANAGCPVIPGWVVTVHGTRLIDGEGIDVLEAELQEAWRGGPVVVRSSSVVEDGDEESMADSWAQSDFSRSPKKRDLPIGSLIQRRATPSGGGRPHDAAPRGSVSSARARLSI